MNILDLAILQASKTTDKISISNVVDNMIKIRKFFDENPAIVKYYNGKEVSNKTKRRYILMGL